MLGTLFIIIFFAAGWWYSSRHNTQQLLQFSGTSMGTTYTVKAAQAPDNLTSAALRASVEGILAQINRQMSTYDPQSELSQFNQNSSAAWITASPELQSVVETALRISQLTDGAFDVTVGPLVNLWGFGPSAAPNPENTNEAPKNQLPSDTHIQQTLERVGYEWVQTRVTPPAIQKQRPDVYIDLSALAKGYAVDKVAEHLESVGIINYLVEIGGELRGKGHNPNNVRWKVAIEEPNIGKRAIQRIVKIVDTGIATSGNYRNFFEIDGQRYSHTINPRTGHPVRHELASVTVFDASTMHADAMATALLVMGPEHGFELAQRQGLAAFFIVIENNGFKELKTQAFQRYLIN